LLLADGSLLAAGYVFVRPDALTPIVDPETLAVLPLHNKHARSIDGGRTWTSPERFEVDGRGLELSGPCIQLGSGRIIGAAPPFHLGAYGHSGWIIASDDNGHSWFKLSEFFASPGGNVSAWESRLCEYAPGKVAVLFWAYDNKAGTNLNNHLVLSDDGGQSFSAAIDTGIRGQASNLVALDSQTLLTIHAHREPPVGLVVRRIGLGGDGIAVQETLDLFSNNAMASNSADIAQQFGSLKFGQPSLLPLGGGEFLAALWQVENCQHIIKGFRLTL
jgi:sialidase-1